MIVALEADTYVWFNNTLKIEYFIAKYKYIL